MRSHNRPARSSRQRGEANRRRFCRNRGPGSRPARWPARCRPIPTATDSRTGGLRPSYFLEATEPGWGLGLESVQGSELGSETGSSAWSPRRPLIEASCHRISIRRSRRTSSRPAGQPVRTTKNPSPAPPQWHFACCPGHLARTPEPPLSRIAQNSHPKPHCLEPSSNSGG